MLLMNLRWLPRPVEMLWHDHWVNREQKRANARGITLDERILHSQLRDAHAMRWTELKDRV